MCRKERTLSKTLEGIKKELKKKTLKNKNLTLHENELVRQIVNETKKWNRNNVTRTKAYLDFYLRHSEIHWAFLGHMVSRNGGWNMTDLKGGILTRLLTKKEALSFFSFLERGNWLIFQDAYPQFLLYEESLKHGRNLFYLLPSLNVSVFMEAIWNDFWKNHDTWLLAMAQIINEQSYLESRVIHHPAFKKKVFSTLEFKIQDLLSMNHILLPYQEKGKIKLVGQTLRHFESLHERILLGKRLYHILFEDENRLKLTEKWAKEHPHTGSRKDYWPHLFNDLNEGVPGTFLNKGLKNCQLLPGSPRFFSPKLQFAWKNVKHEEAERGDWFKRWQVIYYLVDSEEKVDGEIENEYCKTLERLELAALTKKAISILE